MTAPPTSATCAGRIALTLPLAKAVQPPHNPPMDSALPAHLVFVDFENVPSVDLALISGTSVHVTLLIGEKQRRLDLPLVRQIHQHASQVTLIEVGASGRNALDMVLACHLGKAAAQRPEAIFYIVSRDKDFDPLIKHLRAEHADISRHNAFAELPCFVEQKPQAARRPAGEPARTKLDKLITTLSRPNPSRPKRKARLLAHINAFYGNGLSDAEQSHVLAELGKQGVLTVHPDGKVTYR